MNSEQVKDIHFNNEVRSPIYKNGFQLTYTIDKSGKEERCVVKCICPTGEVRVHNTKHPKEANKHYNFWMDAINKAPKTHAELDFKRRLDAVLKDNGISYYKKRSS